MGNLIAPLLTTTLLFGLAACSEEVPPKANSATCAPGAYKEALSEISSPAKRTAFAGDCKTVHKHEESEAAFKKMFKAPPLIPLK